MMDDSTLHPLRDRTTATTTNLRVSVIIPAHNEEQTLSTLIPALTKKSQSHFDMTIMVVDDHSTDDTAKVASSLGAQVAKMPKHYAQGKGEAISFGIHQAPAADIYVTCDADLRSFTVEDLVTLVNPLVERPELIMSRAAYRYQSSDGSSDSTQRVTRLMAKPLLAIFFPELSHLRSPLAGEIAFRSVVIENVRLLSGYSIDVGLLIDAFSVFGIDAIEEIEIGHKVHRHHSLEFLTQQAREVATAILFKADKLTLKEIEETRHFPFELPSIELT